MPSPGSAELTVASFNVHAGVRRDGTPFDLAEVLRTLDADVVVVQEVWWPDGDPEPLAGSVPDGYVVRWSAVGTGRLRDPGDREGRGLLGASAVRMEHLGGRREPVAAAAPVAPPLPGARRRGEIGTAVLSRLPVVDGRVVPLEPLPRDHAARSVVLQTVRVGSVEVEVAGTHMAHLSQGSLRHFAALRSMLGGDPRRPRLLMGDMNLWGTVVERVLPGWRRAVRGRTWPAAFPVAQPDHVLVAGPVAVVGGGVLPPAGSDHRPVRATVRVSAP